MFTYRTLPDGVLPGDSGFISTHDDGQHMGVLPLRQPRRCLPGGADTRAVLSWQLHLVKRSCYPDYAVAQTPSLPATGWTA